MSHFEEKKKTTLGFFLEKKNYDGWTREALVFSPGREGVCTAFKGGKNNQAGESFAGKGAATGGGVLVAWAKKPS